MLSIRNTYGEYVEMRKNSIGNFFKKPIFFNSRCQLTSWQSKKQPTLLVSKEDWDYISNEDVTHAGAFGEDYRLWDVDTINERWITGYDPRGTSWVIVWKFPGDLNHLVDEHGNKVYKKIYNVPLPVGAYSLYDDSWTGNVTNNVKKLPKNTLVEKIRIDVPTGNGIHYLEDKNETRVAMIGSHFFIEDFWKVKKKEKENVIRMLNELLNLNIYAFPCYSQHHAIVFYKTVNDDKLITPSRFTEIVMKNKKVLQVLEGYSYYSLKSWASNYIKYVSNNLLESVKINPQKPSKESFVTGHKVAIHRQKDPTGSLLRKIPSVESDWSSNISVPNDVQVKVYETDDIFTFIKYNNLKGWVRSKHLLVIGTAEN